MQHDEGVGDIAPAHNEYEREPVPAREFKSFGSFLTMYAGEHAAGTEFMIGPLFLTQGVSAFDLIVGLLLGNLLAVLSWRFLTAEVATKHRLTLYYQLERITGRKFVIGYNLLNGILFCFLAGSMITVSATAVGIPFGLEMPALDDTLPNGPLWILIVLAIGAVISIVAARGYDTVSRFASVAAPWMVAVFLACGIIALDGLGIGSFAEFWDTWNGTVNAFPVEESTRWSFWHVVIWSWFANAAMHVGMSDLSVFRYAKEASAGWATAAGMYVGHYMAWIAAALLYALYLQSPEALTYLGNGEAPPVAPGPMTYSAIGVTGLLVVIVAGWTTANPTIYRAGLAFQGIFPKASTARVTLIAGGIATLAGIFPAFAMQLLGFVATYGFLLAPVGAIIVFEHFFGTRFGLQPFWSAANGNVFNLAAFLAWVISIAVFYSISAFGGVFLSFLTAPAFLTTGVLYIVLSKLLNKKIAL